MWPLSLSVNQTGDSDAYNKAQPHFCERLNTKSGPVIQGTAVSTTYEGCQPEFREQKHGHTHLLSPLLMWIRTDGHNRWTVNFIMVY